MNKDVGILVNVSRAIIFTSSGEFCCKTGEAAKAYQQQMEQYLEVGRESTRFQEARKENAKY